MVLAAVFPALDARVCFNGLYAASSALLLVTLALGLGIVVGLAGLLDLGYAAFFAIGSYTAAILTSSGSPTALTLPAIRQPWLGLGLAGLVAATFGVLFGVPSVRTRGEYLAIVTLAFGEIVPSVIVHLPDLTGGPRGMSGIPPPGLWDSGPLLSVYLVTLGAVVLIYLGIRRLIRARVGRAWAAIRDDELAAQAVGIDPPRLKLLAFAVGAACAGAAGALFAGLFGYVEPAQFDLTLSLMVLAAVVVGGRWGLVGVVGGALVIALYDRVVVDFATQGVRAVGAGLDIPELLSADLRGDNFTIFGLALYLAVRFRGRSSRTE